MLLEIGEILGLMFPRPGVTPPSPMLSDMSSAFPMDLCHALAATCTGKVHAAHILEHEARADRRMEHAAIRRRGTRLTSWSMKRSKRERARQRGGARDKGHATQAEHGIKDKWPRGYDHPSVGTLLLIALVRKALVKARAGEWRAHGSR